MLRPAACPRARRRLRARALLQRVDHAVEQQQREAGQHHAGGDRAEQQQVGLEREVHDVVARHQADGGIALAQLLQLLLDVGQPVGQPRGLDGEFRQRRDVGPDLHSERARMRGARLLNGDVHLVEHLVQERVGVGDLGGLGGADAVVGITLKRHLRQVVIVGGDERRVVDVDGVVDGGVLLLAREQAERDIDQQEADRHRAQLPPKGAMIAVDDATRTRLRTGAGAGGRAARSGIDLGGGHAVTLPYSQHHSGSRRDDSFLVLRQRGHFDRPSPRLRGAVAGRAFARSRRV